MQQLNGAEIVFNPSATITGLRYKLPYISWDFEVHKRRKDFPMFYRVCYYSEPLWAIEARNAAIANR